MLGWRALSIGWVMVCALCACGAGAGSDGGSEDGTAPVVVSESKAGLSITASSAVFERIGVASWQIEGDSKLLRVHGLGADAASLVEMSFASDASNRVTVVDHLANVTRVMDDRGALLQDDFPAASSQAFDALSLDMDAIRAARSPIGEKTKPQAWDDYPCSACYGIIQFCGNLEPDYDSPDGYGLLTCQNLERCGWCFSFGGWW